MPSHPCYTDVHPHTAHQAFRALEPELLVCASCASTLVFPTWFAEAQDGKHHVDVFCPECMTHALLALDLKQRWQLEDEWLDGCEAFMSHFWRFVADNFNEEIEGFAKALALDLITADDFNRH